MKTIAVIAGLIALFGIAGTPDYVLDIERENDALRAELKRATLALNRARLHDRRRMEQARLFAVSLMDGLIEAAR